MVEKAPISKEGTNNKTEYISRGHFDAVTGSRIVSIIGADFQSLDRMSAFSRIMMI